MADAKISALPASTTPLAGTEVLPVVQSSTTKQVSVANLTAGRAVSAASLALTSSPLPATSGGTGQSSAFNANGVVYASSTSALATTSTFVYNGTNVGIGAASAGAKLHVFKSNQNQLQLQCDDTGQVNINMGGTTTPTKGAIYFSDNSSSMWFNTASTQQMTISSAGNVTLNTGNLIQGTAAKGINFTANTPAAGMTSQLLNWYEEGNWTPAQGGGLTVVGTFSSTGKYIRIGKQVTAWMNLTSTTSVSVNAGGVITNNLPYSVSGDPYAIGAATNAANTANITVQAVSTQIYSNGAIAATTNILVTVTYITS